MARSEPRYRLFNRRAALLGGGQALLLSLLMGRMYYLQVVESEEYKTLAEENRINFRLLVPPRGEIVDRFGEKLASNRKNYRIDIVAEEANDVGETLKRLQQIIPLGQVQVERLLKSISRKRSFVPVPVAENLTWNQFAQVNVALPDLPGIHPDVGVSRNYPKGVTFGHIVGYVGPVSPKELTGDPLLEHPGFRIGKNGVESSFDTRLRGSAGNSQVEVNAFGRVIRELKRQEGAPGDRVVLTIDADLQEQVTRLLADESASAVVMDISNGEILAMVSNPGYDPNAFSLGISTKTWNSLLKNPRAPLSNKAISGQYPPGSTFKMIVALAALEAGVISHEEQVHCNGVYELGKGKFHCWRAKYGGHGWVGLHESIEQSCDVYFYEIAKRVGVRRIAEMARRFGLGDPSGIEISGERDGLIPTPDWKKAVLGKPWSGGETLITGIGQGFVLSTPLQLAVMTARMANGGYAVDARLIRDEAPGAPAAKPEKLAVSRRNLLAIQKAMEAVITGERGTARAAAFASEEGMSMAGKTGTAQVRRITKAERQKGVRKNSELPWEERDHSLFVGYGPVEKPRYAAAVVIEHGGSGTNAAKLTREVLRATYELDPLSKKALGHLAARSRSTDSSQG